MQNFFIRDRNILYLIGINTVTIFLQAFPDFPPGFLSFLEIVDTTITILFILEMVFKIQRYQWNGYISSWWNRLDFGLVVLSLPSLAIAFVDNAMVDLDFLLVLRVTRLFKFFRFLRFVPGVEHMILGVGRALRSSILVLLGFFIFLFISSLISTQLFHELSPEHFGNPVRSFYSVFKIFTVEGWFEVPDQVAENASEGMAFFTKLFFSFLLVTGGIIGLSIVNSIFVDAMVSDNNDELVEKVEELKAEIQELKALLQNAQPSPIPQSNRSRTRSKKT